MAGIYEILEKSFKEQYPQRASIKRFWYLRTDEYQKYYCLDWLPNDSERIAALNEIKEEAINTLPPKHKSKAEILEIIDWKINSLQYLSQNTTQSKTATLPEGLNTPKARALLERLFNAGFLDKEYQPLPEYNTLSCWVAIADYIINQIEYVPIKSVAEFWKKKNIYSNINKGRSSKHKYNEILDRVRARVE